MVDIIAARIKYAGMTTNERLFFSGNLDKFDHAIRLRDKQTATMLLENTGITRKGSLEIVETILSNPEKYGHKSMRKDVRP